MTEVVDIKFESPDFDTLPTLTGLLAVIIPSDGKLNAEAKRLNTLLRGGMARLTKSEEWHEAKAGDGISLAYPERLAARSVLVVKLDDKADQKTARRAGATIAKAHKSGDLTVLSSHKSLNDILLGVTLRSYRFSAYKSDAKEKRAGFRVLTRKPDLAEADWSLNAARARGVIMTRDLVNEPANVLTTNDFATRLLALSDIGIAVEVLDEPELANLGMRAMLGVGQGSASPSKVVVMRWNGGGNENPFALVGKGVVFDTGGISIKPAAGMEQMTCDMGGAGVVAGVMRTLALRRAKANVVGVVGLVENMPDGLAQRPGDIVKSMKGDTIEVINTDAEGRLVLADVLWYVQERFNPVGMINLATLTGAMLVALGHEKAGVFSNSDTLANQFLKAANAEGEGAWRMPMDPAYDKKLDSRLADMVNSCGRFAGSITAAHFLGRFVKPETPWVHLDIAGVALPEGETDLAPKGASGWGVLALDRLIRDEYEAG